MATKVGINGFGRIGRNFFRAYLDKNPGFEIVAVNDLGAPDVLAHVLRYDSTHGLLDAQITHSDGEITVDGKSFQVLSEREPDNCRGATSASRSSSSRPASSPIARGPRSTWT